MFCLYEAQDAGRRLSPRDFQFIQTPCAAFSNARIYYEMDYRRDVRQDISGDLPQRNMKNHIDSPSTKKIAGKYRWNQDVYHYFNLDTKLNVMTKRDGNFISGWKLSEQQIIDLKEKGNVV